jgi:UDP-glucose 4-epimerase
MKPLTILVVGGCGYIGTHMVKALLEAGHNPITLDNLSKGHLELLPGGDFVEGDIQGDILLDRIFSSKTIDAVMHFAALIEVGESVQQPLKYYRNNVAATATLLEAMVRHKVCNFIFSSSAAVYGEPEYTPIDETHPLAPTSPYGETKLYVENMLKACDVAYGLKSICLRYFNAAGADQSGTIGEKHNPESHLIPLVLQTAAGLRENISIFGNDYPTSDGTCVRDYIHVSDLVSAHLLALEALMNGSASAAYNLGNGNGFSVRDVIGTACRVTGREIPVAEAPRRPGDPAVLVASSGKALKELGWQPRWNSLEDIVRSAWNWHKKG